MVLATNVMCCGIKLAALRRLIQNSTDHFASRVDRYHSHGAESGEGWFSGWWTVVRLEAATPHI